MSEMIEKVEDALWEALTLHLCDADGLALQGNRIFISGDAHIDRTVLARAALEALREPSEAMLRAPEIEFYDGEGGGFAQPWGETIRDTWQAMIDAALSPDTPEAP